MLLQSLSQVRIVEVGINLGCENILVTQQLLHLTDICTPLQQMRSEGVAEGVGADLLINAGTQGSLLDDGENHHARELLATIIQEDKLILAAALVARLQIELYAITRHTTHRHKALLVAFANHTNISFAKKQITQTQVAQLANTQTTRVQHLQHSTVAQPLGRRGVNRSYQAVNLLGRKRIGQRA